MKEGATPIEGNRNQLISDIKKAKEVKLTAIKGLNRLRGHSYISLNLICFSFMHFAHRS